MNLLFLDSEMGSGTMLIMQASAQNIGIIWEFFFVFLFKYFPLMSCGTFGYFFQFRSVHEDVQVFKITLLNFFLIPLEKLVGKNTIMSSILI